MKPAVECVSRPSRPNEDLPSQPSGEVVGQSEKLQRRAEHEFARVQHEGFPVDRLHQAGQLVLLLGRVDVGVASVVEHPKQAIEPDVDAGRLDQGVVERVDPQPPGGDLGPKITIGEQHPTSVSVAARWLSGCRVPRRWDTRRPRS